MAETDAQHQILSSQFLTPVVQIILAKISLIPCLSFPSIVFELCIFIRLVHAVLQSVSQCTCCCYSLARLLFAVSVRKEKGGVGDSQETPPLSVGPSFSLSLERSMWLQPTLTRTRSLSLYCSICARERESVCEREKERVSECNREEQVIRAKKNISSCLVHYSLL